jgi:hypothetical protein
MAEDLWPEFEAQKIRSPKTVLVEQAAALANKTKNVLTADIITSNSDKRTTLIFRIVAPALNNYKYNLFTLMQHPIFLYPCDISSNVGSYNVLNEEGLVSVLKQIFNSPETIQTINSLYSQSLAE